MILTCTSCSTRYYADDNSIGAAGRTVRCAACGHSWFAEPHLELHDGGASETRAASRPEPLTRERVERLRRAAEQPGPAPSAAAKFRAQQAERMRRERARAAVAAWGATGVALAASASGMVVFRQDVAEIWPNSASAYAMVGLDVNIYGLKIENLAVERAFDGPTPILLVGGEVQNVGRDDKALPPMRIALHDTNGNEIYEIVHAIDAEQVAAGAVLAFQIRLENPPADAVDLEATFASYEEANIAGATPRVSPPGAPHLDDALDLHQAIDEQGHLIESPAAANDAPIDGLAPRFTGDSELHG